MGHTEDKWALYSFWGLASAQLPPSIRPVEGWPFRRTPQTCVPSLVLRLCKQPRAKRLCRGVQIPWVLRLQWDVNSALTVRLPWGPALCFLCSCWRTSMDLGLSFIPSTLQAGTKTNNRGVWSSSLHLKLVLLPCWPFNLACHCCCGRCRLLAWKIGTLQDDLSPGPWIRLKTQLRILRKAGWCDYIPNLSGRQGQ